MDLLSRLIPVVHWAPRLVLAAIFIPQGYSKFIYPGIIPPPYWQLVGVLEILGGVFLVVGAFGRDLLTRAGALLILVVMTGATIMMFQPNAMSYGLDGPKLWVGPMGGLDLQALTAAVSLYYLVNGNEVR